MSDWDDVTDIREARRIMKVMYSDIQAQYWGKVFYGCLSAIMLIVGIFIGASL